MGSIWSDVRDDDKLKINFTKNGQITMRLKIEQT